MQNASSPPVKRFLASLNTYEHGLAGFALAVLGFVSLPQVSPVLVSFVPKQYTTDVAGALLLIGLALSYFGKPVSLKPSAPP